ncbi:hypothetical protein [Sphingomonas sp. URHD0057]|uniref:hypothetical protein n=1 Tax=Sphingomonas sp. URHD0057 TaxID=1380389 RepID=UPI00048AE56D|nr:hypothetical protein [Sphingomonas sp. URHD0057]
MVAYLFFVAAAAASPVTTDSPPPAKKEKMICKSDSFVGSHVSRRICKTEAEWRAGKENAKDTLNAIGRGGDYRIKTGPN